MPPAKAPSSAGPPPGTATAAAAVSRDGFSFVDHEFFAQAANQNRHRRATPAELQAHFGPADNADAEKPQQEQRPAHWYEAQLIHYGLPPSKTKAVARMRLFDAVSARNLQVPARVAAIEKDLKKEWNKNARDAKKAAAAAAAAKPGHAYKPTPKAATRSTTTMTTTTTSTTTTTKMTKSTTKTTAKDTKANPATKPAAPAPAPAPKSKAAGKAAPAPAAGTKRKASDEQPSTSSASKKPKAPAPTRKAAPKPKPAAAASADKAAPKPELDPRCARFSGVRGGGSNLRGRGGTATSTAPRAQTASRADSPPAPIPAALLASAARCTGRGGMRGGRGAVPRDQTASRANSPPAPIPAALLASAARCTGRGGMRGGRGAASSSSIYSRSPHYPPWVKDEDEDVVMTKDEYEDGDEDGAGYASPDYASFYGDEDDHVAYPYAF